ISTTTNKVTHEYFEQLVETVRSRWIPDPNQAAALGVDCLRSVEVKFLKEVRPPTRLPRPLGELEVLRDKGLRVVLPMLPLAEEEEQSDQLQPAASIF
ncbi:hypothetical protein V5O48_018962, partial [Marasmius crinis-equi]